MNNEHQIKELEENSIKAIEISLGSLESEYTIPQLHRKLHKRYSKKEIADFFARQQEISEKYGRGFSEYLLDDVDSSEHISEWIEDLENDGLYSPENKEALAHYFTGLQMTIKKSEIDLTYSCLLLA